MKLFSIFFIIVCYLFSQQDEKIANYLKSDMFKKNKNFSKLVTIEYEKFILSYPKSLQADFFCKELANIYLSEKEYHSAFYYFFLSILTNPINKSESYTSLINIITKENKTYQNKKEQLEFVIKNLADNKFQDNYYQFIKTIYEINSRELDELLIKGCDVFIKNFGDSHDNDKIYLIKALTLRKMKEFNESYFIIDLTITLYPNSSDMAFLMYQAAELNELEFNVYQTAADIYQAIEQKYPNFEKSNESLFKAAEILNKELKKQNDAINVYVRYVKNYPKDPKSIKALNAIAEIYLEQKDFENAISAYRRIVSNYKDDKEAIKAQENIILVYSKKMKKDDKACEERLAYANLFPSNENSAEFIYDAAIIYYEDLKLLSNSNSALTQLFKQFPNSKYAIKGRELEIKLNLEQNLLKKDTLKQ